ncbi:MAG: AtpZ/AtpI family protein [Nitrospirae bacterium]|nr:AtpZ/AtpI family protein [Nitrospirota bacterium]
MLNENDKKDKDTQDQKPFFRQFLEASSIGMYLVIATFVGLAMGYGLDSLMGTSPYMTFIMLFVGIIAGFREIFRVVNKQGK